MGASCMDGGFQKNHGLGGGGGAPQTAPHTLGNPVKGVFFKFWIYDELKGVHKLYNQI